MAALHLCLSSLGAGLASLPRFPAAARRRTSILRRAAPASTSASSQATMEELAGFLEQDLPHLFDEQGIDRSRYEERVEFRDPLTSYNTLTGYLLNIQMLRLLFGPQFFLHLVKQTGAEEITTRWTMRMQFRLLPWKPELLFTGISVLRVNVETGKFCSHVDIWDSIQNNDYFSFEAAKDVLKQLRYYKTPDLETPKYTVLKRTRCYEVRLYEPFVVVESRTQGVATSKGFNNVTGYIFGNNMSQERIKMTTPVFNERAGEDVDKIQVVIPSAYELSDLPAPTSAAVELREVDRRHAVATKFSGEASDAVVREREQSLRSAALADGLKPAQGFLLARYNDPGRTPAFLRRNEVVIWLDDFRLELGKGVKANLDVDRSRPSLLFCAAAASAIVRSNPSLQVVAAQSHSFRHIGAPVASCCPYLTARLRYVVVTSSSWGWPHFSTIKSYNVGRSCWCRRLQRRLSEQMLLSHAPKGNVTVV